MSYHGRDIEAVPIGTGQYLVAACDSCGAVGLKELDLVRVPSYITGRFTARVALLEVITVGSRPQLATVAVANEPDPTGNAIFQGVYDELDAAGLAGLPLAVSTEKNFTTRETGLGISVIGICPQAELRVATTLPGDFLYCLGIPKVGAEITGPADPGIVQCRHIQRLLTVAAIHDLIPVGSRGIDGEAQQLAAVIGARWRPRPDPPVNLTKSGGPATCLIFSAATARLEPIFASPPCSLIGQFEPLS